MKISLCILGTLALLAVSCSPLRKAVILPVKVEGIAMKPALNDGDRIVIDRGFEKLERGDIVIFYYPFDQSKSYIKRIIGLPNERVETRKGKVLVNGKDIEEGYVEPVNNQSLRSQKEVTVPADSFYVMGDNRDNSNDSRSWGPLPRKLIYGKFVGKYYAAKS
jgi:signal peptidase I